MSFLAAAEVSILEPASTVVVGMIGDPAVGNKLVVTGASALAISGAYTGAPYVMNGPAAISPPAQLGFKPGDKLKLQGAVGTEPNHGRELTLSDPATITVFETLVFPDANEYEFTVYRRSPCIMTLSGVDALAQLCAWSAFGSPDTPVSALRPRWTGVGSGYQVELRGVTCLVAPLEVTAGVYLKALDASLTVFPTITSVVMRTVFGLAEISYALPAVEVSEAGLYFDAWVSGVGSLDPTYASNTLAFYKSIEPLVKLDSFSMEVLWELNF
jgi:hypothetical protein